MNVKIFLVTVYILEWRCIVKNVVVATATFSKTYDLRAQLAVKTARACMEHGYALIVVDGGSPRDFLEDLGTKHVFAQALPGMGPSRRQAMKAAGKIAGPDGLVLWMEPEKYTLVSEIEAICVGMMGVGADLAVPDRGPLDSYPLAQRLAEPLGNIAFERITGVKLDMWSGPRMMNAAALQYFLAYEGEYGDKWDSIFIPVLRVMWAGLKVVSVPINYVHPPEQTQSEEESLAMVMKRIDQLGLVLSMAKEAERLGPYRQ